MKVTGQCCVQIQVGNLDFTKIGYISYIRIDSGGISVAIIALVVVLALVVLALVVLVVIMKRQKVCTSQSVCLSV